MGNKIEKILWGSQFWTLSYAINDIVVILRWDVHIAPNSEIAQFTQKMK